MRRKAVYVIIFKISRIFSYDDFQYSRLWRFSIFSVLRCLFSWLILVFISIRSVFNLTSSYDILMPVKFNASLLAGVWKRRMIAMNRECKRPMVTSLSSWIDIVHALMMNYSQRRTLSAKFLTIAADFNWENHQMNRWTGNQFHKVAKLHYCVASSVWKWIKIDFDKRMSRRRLETTHNLRLWEKGSIYTITIQCNI